MFSLSKRNFWHEFKRSREGNRPRLSLGLMLFDEGYTLDLFGLFIPLLFLDRWRRHPHEMMESWGVCHYERSIHFNWGAKCKVIDLPWAWTFIAHEVRREDGSWVPYVGCWERDKKPDRRETFTFDYSYTLKSGEVQQRTATVYVNRWKHRRKWLKHLPLFTRVNQSIDFTFSAEVGERTGSWKGGCISSGETMLRGETAEQTFRRMERDRKF